MPVTMPHKSNKHTALLSPTVALISPEKQQTYSIAVLALPPSQRFRVTAVGALLVLGVIGGRRILLLACLPRRACIRPVLGCPRRRFPPEGTLSLMIAIQYLY
jgi:hypothetical protein